MLSLFALNKILYFIMGGYDYNNINMCHVENSPRLEKPLNTD